METNSTFGPGSIVLAALGGALVGAGVAMLLAPKSGHDTRHQLAAYYHDAKGTVGRVPNALKSASHAAGEAFKEVVEKG